MLRHDLNLALVVLAISAGVVDAAEPDLQLAKGAVAVVEKYCHQCHGVEFKQPGLNVLDRAALLATPKDPDVTPFVVAGKPAESRVWQVLAESYMPPETQPQPTAEEKALLKRWIEAGLPFPPAVRPRRPYLADESLWAALRQDLEQLNETQRQYTRYLSLAHLWNDPNYTDRDLRLVRAAVSKLLNSLSWKVRIVLPRAVDPEATILAIDLRDYGWTEGHQWAQLLAGYPYGLVRRGDENARRVYDLTQCDLAYVRADWFVFAASRPPMYHALLALPDTDHALERLLDVDLRTNFLSDRLWRAGFRQSGVSAQNRLLERHDARYGAYWKSYDFKSKLDQGDLFKVPLGPAFEGNPFRAAFKHDGGELIFHLPNGLQAYMLVDGGGGRIEEGPIAVVSDPNQFSGSPTIVNGISCMGCHKQGMIGFKDTVRATFEPIRGQPTADKVLALFPPQDQLDRLVSADRERFLSAADQATLVFLRDGKDDQRLASDFPEPVTFSSKRYQRPVDAATVARELGLPGDDDQVELHIPRPKASELLTVIRLSETMRRLGMAVLASGEVLPREAWERNYGNTARELKLGIPQRFSVQILD